MFRMHQQSGKFIAVKLQPEEHAEPHVVDAALHCAIHRLGVIAVIVLRPCRMKLLIRFLVIGLLEKNIRPDAGFLELSVILDRRRCNIHIDTANRAILVLNAVNRLDALKDIFNRIIDGILTCFQSQTFVPHILKGNDFLFDLFLGQLLAQNMLIFVVIRAINTAVHAVVRQIKRRKHHDAVAVISILDLARERVNLRIDLRIITREKQRCLAMGQPFVQASF